MHTDRQIYKRKQKALSLLFNIIDIDDIYRVSQNVVYKFTMLVCHIMMNKIYIGTCLRKFKLRSLEGDSCMKTGEWEKIIKDVDVEGKE